MFLSDEREDVWTCQSVPKFDRFLTWLKTPGADPVALNGLAETALPNTSRRRCRTYLRKVLISEDRQDARWVGKKIWFHPVNSGMPQRDCEHGGVCEFHRCGADLHIMASQFCLFLMSAWCSFMDEVSGSISDYAAVLLAWQTMFICVTSEFAVECCTHCGHRSSILSQSYNQRGTWLEHDTISLR